MTHAEQRAKLVEMISLAAKTYWLGDDHWRNFNSDDCAEAILASLHGHYTTNAVDVTEEVERVGDDMMISIEFRDGSMPVDAPIKIYTAMAAASDLTKPEGK